MEFFDSKARRIWREKVISSCEKISEIKGWECRYNFQCHCNAIHDAVKNKDEKVAIVFYIHWENAILHFINYRKWEFIDNTLWYWCEFYDYYFYKWLNKDDFNIWWLDTFTAIRNEFAKMIPFRYKWLVNESV